MSSTASWHFWYVYIALCVGCYASYLGAPPWVALATAIAIAVPNIATSQRRPIEIAAYALTALAFAALAHTVGQWIARVLP